MTLAPLVMTAENVWKNGRTKTGVHKTKLTNSAFTPLGNRKHNGRGIRLLTLFDAIGYCLVVFDANGWPTGWTLEPQCSGVTQFS